MTTKPTRQRAPRRAEPIDKYTAKNGKTSYFFSVTVGTRPDGKPDRRRFTFPTQAEARRELRRITTEVAAATYSRPTAITVDEAVDAWLASRRNVRPVTVNGYRFNLLPITRALGGLRLQSVTKAQLDALVAEMLAGGSRTGKPLAVRTVRASLRRFRAVVEDARRQGLVARNVAELVELPRAASGEMDTWTRDEQARFADHVLGERLAACWLLTVAGLRRSEVLGLEWSAIDFDAGTVEVRQGRVAVTGSESHIGEPKSERGKRVLLMPEYVAALRALRATQAAERLAVGSMYPRHDLVAVHEDGTPVRPELYSDQFRRLAAGAGVPAIRLHDVRHTSVTLMLAAGHSIADVAAWHGHSPEEMLRTYVHATPDGLAAISASLPGVRSAR